MKFTQEISIFKPQAIKLAVASLNTRITQTANEIRLEAAQTAEELGRAIQQTNASISITATEIRSEVSQTYQTKAAMGAYSPTSTVSSMIKQGIDAITMSVTSTDQTINKTTGAALTITLKDAAGDEIASKTSGTIKLDGNVVFTNDLGASGTTTVNGSRIHGGTLILGGNNNENGRISMRDSVNADVGSWDNSGIVVTAPGSLRTSLLTSDGMLHSYRYSNGWLEIGSMGRQIFESNYQTIGVNAMSNNCSGLTLCINGTPYYAMNTSNNPGSGLDLTGYGFRHYFKGDVYCTNVYKTSNGYGWFGEDWGDPWVITGANVQIGEEGSYGFLRVLRSIETYGTVTSAYGTCQGSDSRLKTDIGTIELDESKKTILGLRPVQYRYKEDCDRLRHGFIAQEVQQSTDWDPVVENMDSKYLTLSYEDFIADLVNVVQDQEKRLSRLEGEQ